MSSARVDAFLAWKRSRINLVPDDEEVQLLRELARLKNVSRNPTIKASQKGGNNNTNKKHVEEIEKEEEEVPPPIGRTILVAPTEKYFLTDSPTFVLVHGCLQRLPLTVRSAILDFLPIFPSAFEEDLKEMLSIVETDDVTVLHAPYALPVVVSASLDPNDPLMVEVNAVPSPKSVIEVKAGGPQTFAQARQLLSELEREARVVYGDRFCDFASYAMVGFGLGPRGPSGTGGRVGSAGQRQRRNLVRAPSPLPTEEEAVLIMVPSSSRHSRLQTPSTTTATTPQPANDFVTTTSDDPTTAGSRPGSMNGRTSSNTTPHHHVEHRHHKTNHVGSFKCDRNHLSQQARLFDDILQKIVDSIAYQRDRLERLERWVLFRETTLRKRCEEIRRTLRDDFSLWTDILQRWSQSLPVTGSEPTKLSREQSRRRSTCRSKLLRGAADEEERPNSGMSSRRRMSTQRGGLNSTTASTTFGEKEDGAQVAMLPKFDALFALALGELEQLRLRVPAVECLGDRARQWTRDDVRNMFWEAADYVHLRKQKESNEQGTSRAPDSLPFPETLSDDYLYSLTFQQAMNLGLTEIPWVRGYTWEERRRPLHQ